MQIYRAAGGHSISIPSKDEEGNVMTNPGEVVPRAQLPEELGWGWRRPRSTWDWGWRPPPPQTCQAWGRVLAWDMAHGLRACPRFLVLLLSRHCQCKEAQAVLLGHGEGRPSSPRGACALQQQPGTSLPPGSQSKAGHYLFPNALHTGEKHAVLPLPKRSPRPEGC